ncbi:LPXTG cell wall anchor domain-containing protein [Salinispora sp. H7-4]|uniref:LPXTG cell wall anchor domain-containing protein n=1 Tax=Salinispora sp. H7-4 TaxID=2748321 RepID=UPI0015D1266A|nr:LPXTG cell wall anchor domain-containing protein [Salinispora sp. H7-4]NYT93225.1 LPXTG cell wall anchor domain-containing protein [Salinispora sp. H7-4]
MMLLHRPSLARVGAVALLVAAGSIGVSAPAHAADQADLALIPLSYELAKGVEEARAKPFKIQIDNTRGTADAKSVRVTVETANLKEHKVGVVVPAGCEAAGTTFSCLLGDLPAGTTEDFGIPLFSLGKRGDAGHLVVTVTSATADPVSADNKLEHRIRVAKPGYDLTSWVQDVYADVEVDGDDSGEPARTPVLPGGTAPLDWAVYNHGSRSATGIAYGFTLPAGVDFAELPAGCTESGLDGPAQVHCTDPGAVLEPGEFYTAPARVRVGADVTESVLRPGFLYSVGLDLASGAPAAAPRTASELQLRTFAEVDPGDGMAQFDVFVGFSASPEPTPTPTGEPTGSPSPTATAAPDGSGGGGGLPVTGMQVGLIGGVGAAVLLAGAALLLLSRRRKVVLVNPGQERDTD